MAEEDHVTKEEFEEWKKPIEAVLRTLNREFGVVIGELKWIRWLLMAIGVVMIGNLLASL